MIFYRETADRGSLSRFVLGNRASYM